MRCPAVLQQRGGLNVARPAGRHMRVSADTPLQRARGANFCVRGLSVSWGLRQKSAVCGFSVARATKPVQHRDDRKACGWNLDEGARSQRVGGFRQARAARALRSRMLSTARRYAPSLHDAEDAYQRAAEILLTHEPRGTDDELCRWLRTVVKREALAIRRQRQRVLPAGEPERLPEPSTGQPDTHERTERFEQLQLGAQAIGRLKPQEVRCLLLRAEGYTYKEICAETGWTYTKVNRCRRKDGGRSWNGWPASSRERSASGSPPTSRVGGRRGHRRRPGRSAPPSEELPPLPGTTARVPSGPVARGRAGAARGAGRRWRWAVARRARVRCSGPFRTAPQRWPSAPITPRSSLEEGRSPRWRPRPQRSRAGARPRSSSWATAAQTPLPLRGIVPAREEVAPPAPEPSPPAADQTRPADATPAPASPPKPAPTPTPTPSPANEFAPEAAAAAPAAPAPARSSAGEFAPGAAGSAGAASSRPDPGPYLGAVAVRAFAAPG